MHTGTTEVQLQTPLTQPIEQEQQQQEHPPADSSESINALIKSASKQTTSIDFEKDFEQVKAVVPGEKSSQHFMARAPIHVPVSPSN